MGQRERIVVTAAVVERDGAFLLTRRLDGTLAWPGKTAFRIAGPKALAHRVGMSGLDD